MQRVEQGIQAWRAGDLDGFGQLISASGQSSINNYECGAPALIDLYHCLIESDGVYGAASAEQAFAAAVWLSLKRGEHRKSPPV